MCSVCTGLVILKKDRFFGIYIFELDYAVNLNCYAGNCYPSEWTHILKNQIRTKAWARPTLLLNNKNYFMSIDILPSTAWRGFRGKPSRNGLNPTTHLAIVADQNGAERRCFLKFIDVERSPGLLCEGLGWLLASSAGVRVPEFAAIVMVPIVELSRSVDLPSWLSSYTEYPAWCVQVVDGKSVAEIHKWFFWFRRNQCLKSNDAPVVAAFDIWTNNQDRNYGNVIRSKQGGYVAIDHEVLLHELIWKNIYGLEYKERSLLKEAMCRLASKDCHEFKCSAALAADQHNAALVHSWQDVSRYFHDIVPNAASQSSVLTEIYNYLNDRSMQGWMSNELGVIV